MLSVFKDDDETRAELNKLDLPNRQRMVEALLDIRFDKFHALSLAALYKIVPFMETGMRYDEAVAAIPEYGHHSQLYKAGEGLHRTLPPLYAGRKADGRMVFSDDADIPRNPVVLRALNQARKVVNAIVRRYGSPLAVNIIRSLGPVFVFAAQQVDGRVRFSGATLACIIAFVCFATLSSGLRAWAEVWRPSSATSTGTKR